MSTFALNFQRLIEIDTTPQGSSRTYKRIGAGIDTAEVSNNEEISQDGYMDGDGYKSSDAIGAQRIVTFSGHRDTDDDAQNFIFGLESSLGDDRKTNLREYDADGYMRSGAVTLCNLEQGKGGALEKSQISFETHYNGKPSETPATTAPTASATIDTGSVVGTTRFSMMLAAVTNAAKYRLRSASAGTVNANSFIAGLIDYNEGTQQSMTIQCTHAATGDGTITFVFDAQCLTGGTDTVTVEVVTGDTAVQVAEKCKLAFEAESAAGAIGGEFYITRSTDTLTFTAKSSAENDVLYDINFTDTDTTGVTFGAKADGTAGVISANITAAAGQYLQCFEVDANSRVVSFYEKALVSGDIKSA